MYFHNRKGVRSRIWSNEHTHRHVAHITSIVVGVNLPRQWLNPKGCAGVVGLLVDEDFEPLASLKSRIENKSKREVLNDLESEMKSIIRMYYIRQD